MRNSNLILMIVIFMMMVVCLSKARASTCITNTARHRFEVLNGYPHGRAGYVVDHVCALEVGGIDDPANMQYQTISESKKKNRIERTPAGKTKYCNAFNSTLIRRVFNCRGR